MEAVASGQLDVLAVESTHAIVRGTVIVADDCWQNDELSQRSAPSDANRF